ncbi:hypothetical protein LG129_000432 [Listeria monocytogenes]|uniref:hypothetical protein n=1 Tax=Listeria monocytogenes TaxID=1639 RepID=UPI000873D318|nr:hypothetical protein [Listeria monocytogenes]EAD3143868.1 hypothetical protein [Listeria monocytogenes]EAD5208304.1 hypothetical protein [Listeria monocytogenes]EAE1795605.1 hypothetical protein [Listeria monocytogenes]EAH4325150.1 hypothetical protein [Listeria monocytogenes]ECH7051950.1 hypothetical protein [Listeria monocytogenes]
MKKIYISISIVLGFVVLLMLGSFFFMSKEGFPINASGYTVNDEEEIKKFSGSAKYLAQKFSSKRLIEEKGKSIPLDTSRLLFLDNGEIMMMNKAVAVLDIKTVNELPSKTILTPKKTGYRISNQDGKEDIIPQGSIVKAAEGRYLILDEAELTNGKDLNKRIEKNSLVIKNKNNKIKIISGNNIEELASDDVYLKLDNSIYTFELESEILRLNEKEFLNLKLIKVDMNDQAEKFKSLKDSSETSSSKEKQSSTSQNFSSEATSAELADQNRSQNSENQELSSSSDGGVSEASDTQNNKEESDDSASKVIEGGNQLEEDNLKSAVDELNQLTEGPGELPVVQATLNIDGNKANFDVIVQDVASYLKQLNLKIYTMDGDQISSTTIAKDKKRSRLSIADLKHGQQYQAVIDGTYKAKNGKEQKAIFYREVFTMDTIQLAISVKSTSKVSATIQIDSESDLSQLTSMTLSYKENTLESSQKQQVELDIAKMKESGSLTIVLEDLKSNTSYLTTIDEVKTQSGSIKDPKWYQVFTTLKEEPTIESLELEYLSEQAVAKVTPIELKDDDNSIQTIRYVLYEENDYLQNKEEATEVVSTSVNNTGSYGSVELPVNNISAGYYVAVAYITGSDGVQEYRIESPASNAVKIGGKEIPKAFFDNIRPEQDLVTFDYAIIDDDESLIFNQDQYVFFEIYEYLNGVPVGSPVQTFNIKERDKLIGFEQVLDKLKSSTEYIMIATAFYDINDGKGEVREEIGESKPFTTTPVEEVELNYSLLKAEETSAEIEIEAITSVDKLTELVVGVYTKDNLDKAVDKINIDHLLPQLKDKEKVAITFENNLESNTEYIVKADSAKDTGNNEVPVEGELEFLTAKKKPEVDSVSAKFIEKEKKIEAVAWSEKMEQPISDEQNTINKIDYKLAKAKDPEDVISKKTVNENYQEAINFSAPDDFILGEKYIVQVTVYYNNHYTDEEINLTSETIATTKEVPKADITILEKDETGLSLNIEIEDEDEAIVANSVELSASGTNYSLKTGENKLDLPGSGSITFDITGTIETTEGNKEDINLGTRYFRNYVQGEASVSSAASVKDKNLLVDYQLNEFVKTNALSSFEEIKNGDTKVSSKKKRARDGLFQSLNEALPYQNIYFDHQYTLDIDNQVNYLTNGINYTGTSYAVFLSTADGKNSVTKRNSLVLSDITTEAEMFDWTSGTVDERGNILGTSFKNSIDGNYLGIEGSKISDNFNSIQKVDLMKNEDGSYALRYGNQYMNFYSGAGVSDQKEATPIDLYSVSSKKIEEQLDIETPKLAEPSGDVNLLNVGIYDAELSFDLLDIDETFLKNKYGKEYLKINFYESDSDQKIASFDYKGEETQIFDSLDSNTKYRIEVIGSYNLKDNKKDKEIKLFDQEILTKSAPPTLLNSSFNWNSLENAHQIEGSLEIDDKDNVVQEMEYRLYSLENGIEFTDDPQEMEKRLKNETPIIVNNTEELSTFIPILGEDNEQRYKVNQDYVVLTVAKTERLSNNQYALASDKVFVSELKPIIWSFVDKTVGKESTVITFNYSDLDGYIVRNPAKTINYVLENVRTGEEKLSGSFNISSEGEEDIDLGELEENQEYILKLTSQSNNLNGKGNVPWEINKKILISSFDVSLDAFYVKNYEDMKLTMEQLNFNVKDSITVKSIKTQLYRIENMGLPTEQRVFMTEKVQTLPTSYPTTIETVFNLENYESGYYLGRSEISYSVDGDTHTKILENWTYPVSHIKNEKYNIDVSENKNKISVKMADDRLGKEKKKYKVVLKNQFDTVVEEKIVSAKTLRKEVLFSELPSNQYSIQIFDGEACLSSVTYQTGQNKKVSFFEKIFGNW